MMILDKRFFFFILCIYSNAVFSQDINPNEGSIINQQIWLDFYPHFYVNEKLEYYGDLGYRTAISNQNWSRIYARPSLKYHFNNNWEFHSGLGLFYIYNKSDIDRFEITPWQGIQLNWPKFIHISFKHLIKVEERLSFTTNNWNSSFELRFRYKLSGRIKLFKTAALQKWYIPFYGEIFYPINENLEETFRNKGRAGIGLGYNASKKWRFSFLMNWQTSRAGINDQLKVSDFAYQLKIIKHWNRKK